MADPALAVFKDIPEFFEVSEKMCAYLLPWDTENIKDRFGRMLDVANGISRLVHILLSEGTVNPSDAIVSFRELGPPDLCHTVKSSGKSGQKDASS